jgi:hypothetical protein
VSVGEEALMVKFLCRRRLLIELQRNRQQCVSEGAHGKRLNPEDQ